jgi:hypothetical protein
MRDDETYTTVTVEIGWRPTWYTVAILLAVVIGFAIGMLLFPSAS